MRAFIVLIGSLAGISLVAIIGFICFFVHNLSFNLSVTTSAPGDAPMIQPSNPSSEPPTP